MNYRRKLISDDLYLYSGGKKNPDLLLFYKKKRTNESETAKQITKNS